MDGTISTAIAGPEDPAERARAERRAMRLLSCAAMRDLAVETMERLNDGAAGRLHYEEQVRFDDRVKDPYLAISRLSREFCRIVALEDRLDEDAEARAKRLAEEEAERERKARAAAASPVRNAERDAARDGLEQKKRAVRDAVGRNYLDISPKTTEMGLNRLLDELIDDYELDWDDDLDEAYADAACKVVARICEEAGIEADQDAEDGDDTPQAARLRLEAMAQAYLDQPAAANGNAAEVAMPPPALAQGPPG